MNKVMTLNQEIRHSIMIALVELMKQKRIEEIGIVDIVQKAGVSRNSFYRNFDGKEDILKQYIDSITQKFVEQANIPVLDTDWKTYVETILKHMYRYREFVDILIRNHRLYLISDIFDRAIVNSINGRIDDYHAVFLSGGMFNVFQTWAGNGYHETPEQIASYFEKSVLNI